MTFTSLQGHLPWSRWREYLPAILALELAPEIAFKGPELDDLQPADLDIVAGQLRAAGRRPTVHAPFFDLSPGALDPLVRAVTARRLTQSLEAAARLGAHLMVIHPGYDRWRYPKLAATWGEHAATTLAPLAEQAGGYDCRLAVENIYEESPETLETLVATLDSPWLGHCFDIGHWQIFAKRPMAEWLERIAPRLLHLHLHDNLGVNDDHLPVGEGRIDFTPLLQALSNLKPTPSITFEARDPAELFRSRQNFLTLFAKECHS